MNEGLENAKHISSHSELTSAINLLASYSNTKQHQLLLSLKAFYDNI